MFFELLPPQELSVRLVVNDVLEVLANGRDEVSAELDLFVVLLNRGFDVLYADVGCIAAAVLYSAAEEVPVDAAVLAHGALLDEAAVDAAFQSAVTAPQASFEVVRVHAPAFACNRASLKDALHMVERDCCTDR